jgi:hypothetical protein
MGNLPIFPNDGVTPPSTRPSHNWQHAIQNMRNPKHDLTRLPLNGRPHQHRQPVQMPQNRHTLLTTSWGPLDPQVSLLLHEVWVKVFSQPSSLHSFSSHLLEATVHIVPILANHGICYCQRKSSSLCWRIRSYVVASFRWFWWYHGHSTWRENYF